MKSFFHRLYDFKMARLRWLIKLLDSRLRIIPLYLVAIGGAFVIAYVFHQPFFVFHGYNPTSAWLISIAIAVGEFIGFKLIFKFWDYSRKSYFEVRFVLTVLLTVGLVLFDLYANNYVVSNTSNQEKLQNRNKTLEKLESRVEISEARSEFIRAQRARDSAQNRYDTFADEMQSDLLRQGIVSKGVYVGTEYYKRLEAANRLVEKSKTVLDSLRNVAKAETDREFEKSKSVGVTDNILGFLETSPGGALVIVIIFFVMAVDTRERELGLSYFSENLPKPEKVSTAAEPVNPMDEIPSILDDAVAHFVAVPAEKRKGLQTIYAAKCGVADSTFSRRVEALLANPPQNGANGKTKRLPIA